MENECKSFEQSLDLDIIIIFTVLDIEYIKSNAFFSRMTGRKKCRLYCLKTYMRQLKMLAWCMHNRNIFSLIFGFF